MFRLRAADRAAVRALADATGLHPLLAHLLLLRGCRSAGDARSFLHGNWPPAPDGLPHLDRAVERLVQARSAGEKVLLVGDYDADGVTATAVAFEALRAAGYDVSWRVGNRFVLGYGLHPAQIDEAARVGASVVVALDCGTTAFAAAQRARDLGIDVIVLDHHEPLQDIPDVVAVVNPTLVHGGAGAVHPASVGVTWLFALALYRALGLPDEALEDLLDVVAVGTIADVVPLLRINRSLVRRGLEVLARTRRPGLARLMELQAVQAEDTRAVAFRLAPCLNAAGRLGDAGLAVLALVARGERSTAAAEALVRMNRERQALTDQALADARRQIEQTGLGPALVAAGPWHPGVVGIVAGRLANEYGRPAVVFGYHDGQYRGSARSVEGIDLLPWLESVRDLADSVGGHPEAAGIAVAEERLAEVIERLLAGARWAVPERTVWLDATVRLRTLQDAEVQAGLRALAPFGEGNPVPVFAVRGEVQDVRRMGAAGEHARFALVDDGVAVPTVAFSAPGFPDRGQIELAVRPAWNRVGGASSFELVVAGRLDAATDAAD